MTADGMAIRFPEDEVRPMGMVAAGVGGIKLGARDEVVGMALVPAKGEVLLVSADGKAKRVAGRPIPGPGALRAGRDRLEAAAHHAGGGDGSGQAQPAPDPAPGEAGA